MGYAILGFQDDTVSEAKDSLYIESPSKTSSYPTEFDEAVCRKKQEDMRPVAPSHGPGGIVYRKLCLSIVKNSVFNV
jgi:hypothetical protein